MFHKLAGRTPVPLDYHQYKKYAVLTPYLPETQEFVFQIRSPRLHRQPGEICFPGGYIEDGETPLEAAIRETTEELLVREEHIEVIAPLDIFLSAYNNMVTPFLAELHDYEFTFNTDEVASVFTVPFAFFLENEPQIYYNRAVITPEKPDDMYRLLGVDSYPWGEGRYPVLFYQYEDKLIWGMTARFIHNAARLYRE